MSDFPSTHVSIFSAILAGSTERGLVAIGCFYERYRRGLSKVLQSRLQIHLLDADSILNDFLLKKIASGSLIRKYLASMESPESKHRRFRQYLSRSLHDFALDWLCRQERGVDMERVSPPSDGVEADIEQLLTLEWVQDLLATARTRTCVHDLATGSHPRTGDFLERWIERTFTRTTASSHEELARKSELEQVKQVGAILTNGLWMFRTKWEEVLADDLGTRKNLLAEAMCDASVLCTWPSTSMPNGCFYNVCETHYWARGR